ncbi:alpha/beta fold hydrolase [Auraticoccus monumenti]|uniref:Pimeloyl-ACP methyl ester carboxylesterase n=1 Tax=Auraticoccus monumenti TaxID=675864 RepID=A0A1G6ZAC7_9ACTN|nr:alpha/beta hydrolase [Auraticoccus monumenti]SDD98815.1 Pimeloyl-ACP methyl ester carboxylesterase [Auraticoccus monumenti]
MSASGQLPLGELRPLEGRRLWADIAGNGEPAVVFLPGAGGFGLDLLRVHELVARTTTSVIYDRAGTGWSDDIDLPRPMDEVIDELRQLLRLLGVEPPHLLVGHSLGGLYVQRHAQRFPDEVAAMLLLDPAHEDWDLYMPEALKMANQPATTDMPELPATFIAQYHSAFASLFGAFPDPLRELLVDRHFHAERLRNGFREGANVLAMFDQLRSAGPRPDVPLIILSGAASDATQTLLSSTEVVRQQIEASRRLYDDMAAKTPRGEHRVLPDASHLTIPLARPDAVQRAVRDLLGRAAAA